MVTLEELFARIDAEHTPMLSADPSAIDIVERTYQCCLPNDLKTFYRRYSSLDLFPSEFGPVYRFVNPTEIRPTWLDILGPNATDPGPNNWLTICDVLDSNYVAIEVFPYTCDLYKFIDCFHETFALPDESKVIARSFTELLERALSHGDGVPYYVLPDFKSYGDAFD